MVLLTELEIGEVIFSGQLGEDRGEVDAGRRPRREEGDDPGDVRIALEFFIEAVGAEVDQVLRT